MSSKRRLDALCAEVEDDSPDSESPRHKKEPGITFHFPVVEVFGETPFIDYRINKDIWSLHPLRLSVGDEKYGVMWRPQQMWLSPSPSNTLRIADLRRRAEDLLKKPLQSFNWNEVQSSWDLKPGTEKELGDVEVTIANGFKYNMGNSRGRAAVSAILTALLGDVQVINCGGGRGVTSLEPAARRLNFTPSTSSVDTLLEGEFPMRFLPREPTMISLLKDKTAEIKSHLKRFVPDIIVEQKRRECCEVKELFAVEVRSGCVLHAQSENQLKYELLPVAIKQGSSLGLLICTSQAILMKFFVEEQGHNKCLQLQHKIYDLRTSLFDQMVELICDIYHHMS